LTCHDLSLGSDDPDDPGLSAPDPDDPGLETTEVVAGADFIASGLPASGTRNGVRG
jgi:hypothetical protein